MENTTRKMPPRGIGLAGYLILIFALLAFGPQACNRHAGAQDLGDLNGDREFNKLDYFPLIFGNAEGIKPGPVFKDLTERLTNRPQTLPGSFIGISGVTRISATPTMRDGQEVRVLLLDRSKVRQADKPANSSFSGVSVRVVSGGKIPTAGDPTGTKWMTKTYKGTSSTFAQREFNPNTGADQVTVAWAELYAGFNTAGTPVATLVYPRSATGEVIQESTVILRPDAGNLALRNLRFTPANPREGNSVTPIVDVDSLAIEDHSYTLTLKVNGNEAGSISRVASAGSTTTAIAFPEVTSLTSATLQINVRVTSSTSESTLSDNEVNGTLTFSPQPQPTVVAQNLVLIPPNPANGQSVVPSFTLRISTSVPRSFTVTGSLNGNSPTPMTGTADVGNTAQTVTLPAFTAAFGTNTYRVVVGVSGSSVTSSAQVIFLVNSPNFLVRSIRLSPANPQEGQTVTPSVELGWTTPTNQMITLIGSINGTVVDGGTSRTATAGTSLTTVVMPTFVAVTGTMRYSVVLQSPVAQLSTTDDVVEKDFTVTALPPAPAPTVVASGITFSPSQPAPGQNTVSSFSLNTSSTVARTFAVTGTVDGSNPLTATGSVPVGSNTQTVTMPAFTALSGSHVYRVAVGLSNSTVTTAITASFTVPLVDFSVNSVTMTSTATAGNLVTATVVGRALNLGAPFTVGIQAKDQAGNILKTGTIQFPAGSNVTAQATLNFPAATGMTSVTVTIDQANAFAESSETNNVSAPQPLTVTTPPDPAAVSVQIRNLALTPSQPAPGQNTVGTFTLLTTATVARTYTAIGTVDGSNPLTATGTVPVGPSTVTVTMSGFAAPSGTHTYRVAVSVSGSTATSSAMATFTVPLVDFSLTSVAMAATTTAGTTINATIVARGLNLGAPFSVAIQARANNATGAILGNGTVSLPAGSDVTATTQVSVTAQTGTTSVVFIIDQANANAESNESNNTLSRAITVTAPPPAPNPDARMVSMVLAPSSPTAGQTVVASVVYGINSTIPRNLTITGRLNGATSATFSGTAAAGNTTAAATLTGFTAAAGTNTYVASITFSPATTETSMTNNDVTVTFTVPQPPTPTAPTVPTGLAATPASGSAMVTWNAVTNATSYVVRSQAVGTTTATTVSAGSAFATLTGLTNHQTYQVSVKSVNAAGMSTYSAVIHITPGDGGIMTVNYFGTNLSAPAYIDGRSNWSPASAWPMARTTPGQCTLYATTGKNAGEERDFNLVQAGNTSGSTWTFIQRDLVSTTRVSGAANSVATPIRRTNDTNLALPANDTTVRPAGSTHFVGTRASDGSVFTLTQ